MPHITFIHGICNKPAPDVLIKDWRNALQGDDGIDFSGEGVTSSMVYWADVLYEKPLAGGAGRESLEGKIERDSIDQVSMAWRDTIRGEERAFVETLAARLRFDAAVDEDEAPPVEEMGKEFERIPLPGFVKRRIMEAYLRDVHHYLFNVKFSPRPGTSFRVRDEIRGRLTKALEEGSRQRGPHLLVSHSMGTVISYDCLKRVPGCPRIDALLTIGSPLGLDEIQDELKPEGPGQPGWSRTNGFPRGRVNGTWANIFDALDPVAGFDPHLANDYQENGLSLVEDIHEANYGKWRHDISKYLGQPKLRAKMRALLGL